jgi:hypothetical protein
MQIHESSHRPEPLPANEQLSEEYRQFKALDRMIEPSIIHRSAQAIRNCPVDIRAYYAEHGSLDDLPARGIGAGIKTDLLLILDSGIDTAIACKKRARAQGATNTSDRDIDLRKFKINLERDERRLNEE